MKQLNEEEMLRTLSEMKAYFHQHKLGKFNQLLTQLLADNMVMYNQLTQQGENNEERSSEEGSDESTSGDVS